MANLYGFNPRTRKGCDVNKTKLMIDIRVSIHAPVKDATPTKASRLVVCGFQSTHP